MLNDLTQDHLKSLVTYYPDTGAFIWLSRTNTKRTWNTKHAGKPAGCIVEGYVSIGINNKNYLAHRLAWLYMTGEWPASLIDHRDRNGLNNKWDNLRIGDKSLNSANRPKQKNNTSGLKGAFWDKKKKKWLAKIGFNMKSIYLGRYDTAEEAHAVYVEAAKKYFGEYSRID